MLSPRKHPFYAFLVVATDIVSIVLSFVTAYWLRFSGHFIEPPKGIPSFENYFRVILVMVPIYLLIFRWYKLYSPERHIRRIQEILNLIKAITVSTITLMALTFTYREFSYSRIVFLSTWFFSNFYCSIARYLLIQLEYAIRKKKNRDQVLIVGVNESAQNLIRWSRDNQHYGQDVIGVLAAQGSQSSNFDGVPILGRYEDFDSVIKKYKINDVVIADTAMPRDLITDLILKCESNMLGFKLVADFFGLITHYVDVEYVSNVPLLGLKESPLHDPWNRAYKRIFDFTISFSFLLLFSPILLFVAALIKLSDRGPIFYRQERVGRNEEPFILYKFRTMIVDAEQKTGPVWTQESDDRVTTIGRFFRKFNLDELPQLWNVLVGDMSLVGPRPERPHFVNQFRDQIPHYMSRHKIKSGLTGWAQIHGLRGNTSLEERIKYDLYYLENWTPMLDIEIILATFFAFKNAY